jgi:hypothetical protein
MIRAMRRISAAIAMCVTLTGLGCSRLHSADRNGARATPDASQSGLEATTFVCGADERTLARVLGAGADSPLLVSAAMGELWSAHGFRVIAVPTDRVDAVVGVLRSGRGTQTQWLGQAYSWTEVARGTDSSSRVVALDAERIRLPAGTLRLLARSWIEPGPPREGETAASAMLHVELVPQNFEMRRPEEMTDPLALGHPNIEAEAQGLLFSRLYASMSLGPGQSVLVLPERPEVDWKRVAAEPAVSAKPAESGTASVPAGTGKSAGGAPRLGEVVRANPRISGKGGASDAPAEMMEGPTGPRVLTLGEAMLLVDQGTGSGRSSRGVQRTVLVLTPKLPGEFRLLPGLGQPDVGGTPVPRAATANGVPGQRG